MDPRQQILICPNWRRPIPGAVKRDCTKCGRSVCMDAKNEKLLGQLQLMCVPCGFSVALEAGGCELGGTAIGGEIQTEPLQSFTALAKRRAEEHRN